MRTGRGTLALALLGLLLLSTACCPVTAPPPTAFVAQRLTALADGTVRAELNDGRSVILTGLERLPAVPVYLTGTLLPDGRIAVRSAQPLGSSSPSGAG